MWLCNVDLLENENKNWRKTNRNFVMNFVQFQVKQSKISTFTGLLPTFTDEYGIVAHIYIPKLLNISNKFDLNIEPKKKK